MIAQFVLTALPLQDLFELALGVEQEQRDMRHAVAGCKTFALVRADIGDHVVKLPLLEHCQCLAGFCLERSAKRTLGIMNLNDCREAVADPCQVVFMAHAREIVCKDVAGTAQQHGPYSEIARKAQKLAPALFSAGLRVQRFVLPVFSIG